MATRTRKPARDVYQDVTDKILASLKRGTVPWHKPWQGVAAAPRSLATGKNYRGVNALLLALEADENAYASPYWATFKQMVERGGHLKPDQHGTLVVFWKRLKVEDEETGKQKSIPLLKHFYVFNLDQIEGLERVPADAYSEPKHFTPQERHEAAQGLLDAYLGTPGAPTLRHGGDRACYRPSTDVITLPPQETFDGLDEYYATAFHECGHSTGHESRLDRPIRNTFGDHAYGREELVAEMTSAFLQAEAGIEAPRENSAAYLSSWITTISEDPRAVVVAAGAAQRATDLILGRSFAPEGEATDQAKVA